jgi:transposase
LYGFVRPSTGAVQWLILPEVNTPVFQIALEHFARAVGVGPNKRVLLVVDGAGWHAAKGLRVPDGIELVFLPPYSPELQPAERLWPLVNEALANRAILSLDDLEDLLVSRCRFLSSQPEILRSHTHFHWWTTDGVDARIN